MKSSKIRVSLWLSLVGSVLWFISGILDSVHMNVAAASIYIIASIIAITYAETNQSD